MGGSLEDCFTLPGSYFPSWVFLPDSCWLGRTAQSTDFQHSGSSRVFLLIAAPCGNGGQVHPNAQALSAFLRMFSQSEGKNSLICLFSFGMSPFKVQSFET